MISSKVFRYSTSEFPFRRLAGEMLGDTNLEALGSSGPEVTRLDRASDQATPFHRKWYEATKSDPAFLEIYRLFVLGVVGAMDAGALGPGFLFQKVPTFRIHLPMNVAVGEFHRDRDYGHPPASWNYWVPLTRAFASSTVWVESGKTFAPQELEYGEALRFDGVNLLHGNLPNLTGQARVSFDFRVLPSKDYDPAYGGTTINTRQRFLEGDLYERAP